ncbi:MAG: MBL fold metallo-hydrolase [Pelagibacteraceae bacterium]|jgi:L-ascorbate metabolism protein UlaG (beta-lactamase superfamily)|nr:MBL fold metallo-hydrolase [Pelagibacteraceae bacterium]MBT5214728.1 MBL fold metallo-hydrolase [Pelagibacteraceae bacterium]
MLRRNFLKKIFISTIGIIVMSNKLFAKELFNKHVFKDGIFYNNYISHKMASFKEFWKWHKESTKSDPISFPLAKNDPAFLQQNRTEKTLTWIGHASFLLQVDGLNILTDPHLTKRASPVFFAGPSRTTPPGLSIDDLPDIDIIVISHNHYDHLDYQTILKIMRKQQGNPPLVLVPLKLKKLLQSFGASNVKELEWWESTSYKNLKIHSVPVQHWSNRSFNTNKTLWCGWVFETNNFKCIFVGDTGYSKDFEAIQKKFGFMDLALIPIGAYAPRWFMKDHHCNIEEAIQIHKDLKSKHSVAMHWGTFQLTDEPMDEPPKLLKKLVVEKKLLEDEFIVMTHGESKNI